MFAINTALQNLKDNKAINYKKTIGRKHRYMARYLHMARQLHMFYTWLDRDR